MKYKGILLDIDNTLYDYNVVHSKAKKTMVDFCSNKFGVSQQEINEAFDIARKEVHIKLRDTAASHNRLLYFQKMMEILQINPMPYGLEVYNSYWDSFLETIQPYDGVYSLLEKYKNKICLVTDLTAHIQYRKIKKLNLDLYCDKLVTSEEVGQEKPNSIMFTTALEKLKLEPKEVCMIGDNFKKDILGSANLGIKSIWFNPENNIEKFNSELISEVNDFKDIIKLI